MLFPLMLTADFDSFLEAGVSDKPEEILLTKSSQTEGSLSAGTP